MAATLQTLMICLTLFASLCLVLLAMPQCRLREIVMPFVGWGFAALCGIYAISPVDILPEIALGPFGLVDDAGAVIAGILSARAAIRAGKPSRNRAQKAA